MSLKFTEIKIEKKSPRLSSQNSFNNNKPLQNNKSNHILIDGNNRTFKDKKLDRNKFFINNHYEIESNGNESKQNGGKKNKDEGYFSQTFRNYGNDSVVNSLKMKVNELNGEINRLKNDTNNYNILENNYKQKSKEITELKQENNYIRFQLEDLIRKNKKNNIKNNNFINSNNSTKKEK